MEVAGTQNRCGHTVAAFAAAQEMGYGWQSARWTRGERETRLRISSVAYRYGPVLYMMLCDMR